MLPLIDISEYKCYNILAKIIGLLFERDRGTAICTIVVLRRFLCNGQIRGAVFIGEYSFCPFMADNKSKRSPEGDLFGYKKLYSYFLFVILYFCELYSFARYIFLCYHVLYRQHTIWLWLTEVWLRSSF